MYDIRLFWTSLKKKACHVICFTTADEHRFKTGDTPNVLDSSLGYETIMFSQQDLNDLVHKFRNNSELGKNLLTEKVIAHFDQITNRHPGLFYACLRIVVVESKLKVRFFFSKIYKR